MFFISFIILAAFTAWTLYMLWLQRAYREQDASDEVHYVPTEDGARLALYRYRPKGEVRRGEPVVFVHGLGASKYNLDFDEQYSWARRFAREGFDAWVIDLRGAGQSVPPKKWNWTFDDYANYDIPASLAHIRARTGAEKVHWVGHSMGGMLLYAFLGAGNDHIRSGVTLGSPVRFESAGDFKGSLKFVWLLDYLAFVPVRTIMHLLIPFLPILRKSSFVRTQLNPENTDFKFIRRVAYNTIHHLPSSLVRQFSDWVKNDCFRSYDKQINYQARLKDIDVPIFVMSGTADRMVRPVDSVYAYELMPKDKTKYIEAGRKTGFSHDYGHIDLVFGREANQEILPLIVDWVIHHDMDLSGKNHSETSGSDLALADDSRPEPVLASMSTNASNTAEGSKGFEK